MPFVKPAKGTPASTSAAPSSAPPAALASLSGLLEGLSAEETAAATEHLVALRKMFDPLILELATSRIYAIRAWRRAEGR